MSIIALFVISNQLILDMAVFVLMPIHIHAIFVHNYLTSPVIDCRRKVTETKS